MNINTSQIAKYNIHDGCKPLFDAMADGKIIKKIVCYAGEINKDNPEKDFTIQNFIALEYWAGMSMNGATGKYHDYVDTNVFDSVENLASIPETISVQTKGFYMNWVKSFELYEYIQLPDGREVPLKDLNELFAE